MRMSRKMGLLGNDKMYPESVVVNSGCAMNYWASASETSDKWHSSVPYTGDNTYLGYNSSKVHHNAAICFTSGKFSGKAKNFTFTLWPSSSWSWVNSMQCAWQLSEHNWKTAAEWAAGSKGYYAITDLWQMPDDPNAIAHGTFMVSSSAITISGAAEIKPNTQYVLYLWRYAQAQAGMLVTFTHTNYRQPTITITG